MLSIELQRREYSYQLTEVIYSSWSYMKSKESEFYNELTRLMTEHDSVVRDFVVTATVIRVLQLSVEKIDGGVTSPAEQQAQLREKLNELKTRRDEINKQLQ